MNADALRLLYLIPAFRLLMCMDGLDEVIEVSLRRGSFRLNSFLSHLLDTIALEESRDLLTISTVSDSPTGEKARYQAVQLSVQACRIFKDRLSWNDRFERDFINPVQPRPRRTIKGLPPYLLVEVNRLVDHGIEVPVSWDLSNYLTDGEWKYELVAAMDFRRNLYIRLNYTDSDPKFYIVRPNGLLLPPQAAMKQMASNGVHFLFRHGKVCIDLTSLKARRDEYQRNMEETIHTSEKSKVSKLWVSPEQSGHASGRRASITMLAALFITILTGFGFLLYQSQTIRSA